jgi:hypothetical protein
MRSLGLALLGAITATGLALASPAAFAQENQFLGGIQHFFEGMTPNGSMRQAYEAGRRDEYKELMAERGQFCEPQQAPQALNTQPYGFAPPYAR